MTSYQINSVFAFGRNQGKTIQQVIDDDPFYLEWCVKNVENFVLSPKVMTVYMRHPHLFVDLPFESKDDHTKYLYERRNELKAFRLRNDGKLEQLSSQPDSEREKQAEGGSVGAGSQPDAMKTPRNPDTVIRELNDLNRLIENTVLSLRQFPNDRLLQLALQQDEHRKKGLMKELHHSLTVYLHEAA